MKHSIFWHFVTLTLTFSLWLSSKSHCLQQLRSCGLHQWGICHHLTLASISHRECWLPAENIKQGLKGSGIGPNIVEGRAVRATATIAAATTGITLWPVKICNQLIDRNFAMACQCASKCFYLADDFLHGVCLPHPKVGHFMEHELSLLWPGKTIGKEWTREKSTGVHSPGQTLGG